MAKLVVSRRRFEDRSAPHPNLLPPLEEGPELLAPAGAKVTRPPRDSVQVPGYFHRPGSRLPIRVQGSEAQSSPKVTSKSINQSRASHDMSSRPRPIIV